MHLEHEFIVPVPVKQAWQVLLDVERIAPCLPGATVDSVEGDTFAGRVKVKVGPITVTYKGNATFVERDEASRRVTIKADGREARGSGTAAATVTAVLHDEGERTRVKVDTELAVTGRPAQFGRGVMVEVSNKLLGTFADCLERTIAADQAAPAAVDEVAPVAAAVPDEPVPAAVPEPPTAVSVTPTEAQRPTPEAIDLLGTAGAPVLKRVLPAVAALAVLLILWRFLRRITAG
jgi:carbon monoxide dehydrogenase subunit G